MSYEHKHELPTQDEAIARYPHGTPARYHLGKCRCFPCKIAVSEYRAALNAPKLLRWDARRLTARVDVKRRVDAAGRTTCRYCGELRTMRGINRHERSCPQNPDRYFEIGWIVVHRETGERSGPVFADRAAAYKERDRLNKRDCAKPENELVSAAKARRHLRNLAARGIGVQSVREACGLASSVLDRIKCGMIKRTRRSTEAKILAVTVESAARGKAKIDGRETWRLIDLMVESRLYTKGWLAMQLGAKNPNLQMGRGPNGRAKVSGDKAKRVKALYDRLFAEDARLRRFADPEGERAREKAERDTAVARGGRDRLARALATWEPDEFARRISRLSDLASS